MPIPGSPDEQHHLALAVLGLLPALEQQRELLLAADQRRQAGALQRLEAALGRGPRRATRQAAHRLGEALERLRPEIVELEQAADQPPGRLGDHDAARLGQRLQPGREVRRLADHRLLLRRTLADQIADHDEPGGDADPGRKRLAAGVVEPRHGRRTQREPGPHRPLGVVLVRPRPAEIGEHAVAHVLGDVALEAVDHLGARASW